MKVSFFRKIVITLLVIFFVAGTGVFLSGCGSKDAGEKTGAVGKGDSPLDIAFGKLSEGDTEAAIESFNKIIAADKRNFDAYVGLGHAYARKGDFKTAESYYNKGIKGLEYEAASGKSGTRMFDNLAYAYNGKAYLSYIKGEGLDKALKTIDKAIRLKPEDGLILSTKAEILYKMGRFEEAHEYILEAVEFRPDSKEIQQDLKDIEQALAKKDT